MKTLTFDKIGGDTFQVVTTDGILLGELFRLEDGYYVYAPDELRGGALSDYNLKELYDKIKELNTPQDSSINIYFALEKVGLADWLTKKIGDLVLEELYKTDYNVNWFVGHLQELKNSNCIELYNHYTHRGEPIAGVVIDNNYSSPLSFHCDKKTLREALKEVGYKE